MMDVDSLAGEVCEVVKDPKDLGCVFEGCYMFGAAVAFGLMGMAEAIRSRPVYTWRLVMKYTGMSSSSWHGSEEAAKDSAASMTDRLRVAGLSAPTSVQITREEHAPCECYE